MSKFTGNANGRFDRGGGKRIRLAHRARDVTVNSERCLIKLNLISSYGYSKPNWYGGSPRSVEGKQKHGTRAPFLPPLPPSPQPAPTLPCLTPRRVAAGSAVVVEENISASDAWDQYDRRLGRFEYGSKLVNPNVAMELIAKVKPVASKERIVQCDGGGTALGHPRVFINLDKPGNHACGYCGLRFYNENVPSDGSEQIEIGRICVLKLAQRETCHATQPIFARPTRNAFHRVCTHQFQYPYIEN
ncbi:conserved hypothetical protein [Trichinella spiralis]|uniref:hypothetical protein n=1 Tax=Trichinella spiralis TaxID=6334 RepID=UPI0001EFDDD8|nr:conserved hypothetical protein [Trichinella spiralis]